jgi:hypothetical protein
MHHRRLIIAVVAMAILALALAGVVYALAAGSAGAQTGKTGQQPTMKVLVLVKAKGSAAAVVAQLKEEGATGIYRYHLIKAVAATISRETWKVLRRDPNVARVAPDRQMTLPETATAGEASATAQTGEPLLAPAGETPVAPIVEPALEPEALQLTHAQDAWEIKVGGQPVMGQGVRVGMLDSGTDPSHPDLAGAIEAYRDFTGLGLQSDTWHGTGTSSTIVAQGMPVFNRMTKTYMKVSGMAPQAKVLMAKVYDTEMPNESAYIRALEWLVDEKVDIISGGTDGPSLPANGKDLVSRAVQAVIDKNITFLGLALNEGPGEGTLFSAPNGLRDVVTVGAANAYRAEARLDFLTSGSAYKSGQVGELSGRGPNAAGDFKPDILGVGDVQWALAPTYGGDQGITMFGGTSQATPTVAGNLALAMSAWKMVHPGQAVPAPSYWKNLLASTATQLGFPALENSTGLVNGEAAVKAVLGQGPSLLVSVAADPRNPQSWSVRAGGGSKVSTTIRVKNTGTTAQNVTLRPTMFVANDAATITSHFTLTAADGYSHTESFAVPAGTDFVEARCTWASEPTVALRTLLFDSNGDLVSSGRDDSGYGHLSLAQASLTSSLDRRPAVGGPWRVEIVPFDWGPPDYDAFPPTSDQPAQLRIEFKHMAVWPAVKLSQSTLTLAPGAAAGVTTTVTAPTVAGTHFGNVVVKGDGAAATIPVAIRVPVDVARGGVFSGALTGSSKQSIGGGEVHFYDFVVPSGTSSIQASVKFGAGNLVDILLVNPEGGVVEAKGGDVIWLDWGGSGEFLVPPSAFTRTAEQVIWDDPEPGSWQLVVCAPGFAGRGFAEPYSGSVTLDRKVVSPAIWTVTGARGAAVTRDFTVTNAGPSELAVYAATQKTVGGAGQYAVATLGGFKGSLNPTAAGSVDRQFFQLPQGLRSASIDASCTSTDTRVDLSLWDPRFLTRVVSLADSTAGNSVSIGKPMAGLWSVKLTPAFEGVQPSPVSYKALVSGEAPVPMPGLSSSATDSAPLTVPAMTSRTITASFNVPGDAKSGDVFTGRLVFYTVTDAVTAVGGDHLGSVPVTITVK